MSIFAAIVRRLLAVSAILSLAACGGGGGGGGGGAPGFTLSTNNVAISAARTDSTPASPVVTLTVTGGTLYIKATATVIAIYGVALQCPGTNQCTVTIDPKPPGGLSPGTYFDTVTLQGCADPGCVGPVGASQTIQVSYTVIAGPSISVSPNSLAFTAVEGAALPSAQGLSLSYSGGSVSWTSSIQYVNGSGWLQRTPLSGSGLPATSSVSVGTMPVGVYQAIIYFTAAGTTRTVTVLYTVQSALRVSGPVTFSINSASVLGDMSKTVTVQAADPAALTPISWSASANVPWLLLTPGSGTTMVGNQLTVSLDPSQLGDKKYRYRAGDIINHQGTITITSPTAATIQVPVTMNVNLPMVEYVAPGAVVDNQSSTVILRGHGFSDATSAVNFGASPASSYTVLSDDEIRATHPALAAGSYVVSVPNSLGIRRNNASLSIVTAPGYAVEAILSSGRKNKIIYDPVRGAVYVANAGSGSLDKYVYDNSIGAGSKWVKSSVAVAGMQDIAMVTDGAYVFAVTDNVTTGNLHEIDPSNLSILTTTSLGGLTPNTSVEFDSFGEAVIGRRESTSNGLYHAARLPRNSPYGMLLPELRNSLVGACRDGRRVLLGSRDNSPAVPVYYFDSGNNPSVLPYTMPSTGISLNVTAISSDRTGSRWLLNTTLGYGSNFSYQASLPNTTLASILTHDGGIAYTLDSNGSLRKFNMNSVGAGQFVEIGTGAPLPAAPGNNAVLTLSHDGATLFVAGDKNIVIFPSP